MELRHLRYFVGVAEDLHFGRAAARLGISQPPLSNQIRQLEQEIGVQLFQRNSRAVALTAAGALFLREARATLAQADRAVSIARRAAAGELGELVIGFNASAPFVPSVARAIHDFRVAYPDVHLTLLEQSEVSLRAALAERSIEIGFLRSLRALDPPEGVASRLLLREGFVAAMRPDHPLAGAGPISLAELNRQPMVFYQREQSGGFTEQVLRLLEEAGAVPTATQEVREVSTLFGLVAAGIGITIVAQSLCALQSVGLIYRPIADRVATSEMWILYPDRAVSEQGRNFLSSIADPA